MASTTVIRKKSWIYGWLGWVVIFLAIIGFALVCLFLLPLRFYQNVVEGIKGIHKKPKEVPYHMRHESKT